MKKFLLLAGLLFGGVVACLAQNETDSLPFRKEIGVGTRPVLIPFFPGSPLLNVIYKWGREPSLFRVGTATDFSYSSTFNEDFPMVSVEPELFFGREWRKELASRWLLNYGGDITLNYAYSSRKSGVVFDGYNREYLNVIREHAYGAGFRPFAGILFELSSQFVLGTEASFEAGLQHFSRRSIPYYKENGVIYQDLSVFPTTEEGLRLDLEIRPAGIIFLFYRF